MKIEYHILLIDDEINIGWVLKESLSSLYEISSVTTGSEGIAFIKKNKVDVVLLDLRLPDMEGLKVLEAIQKYDKSIPVVVITAYASIDTAVEAMKLGALDYVSKPLILDRLRISIDNILKVKNLKKEVDYLKNRVKEIEDFSGIVGVSSKTRELITTIQAVADVNVTTLIEGESGTGKELVARALHEKSIRAAGSFVPLNCSAIPETLLESELFGYIKGAFTGAVCNKKGKFEIANNGTIFFDEIGDMPLSLQGKLLRVLEERMINKIGGTKLLSTNARVICATNKNLEEVVKEGKFRKDLFYRISVMPIKVFPLRERIDDIPVLLRHFLLFYSKKYKKEWSDISVELENMLVKYSWPGNVRELKNIIEQICILKNERILKIRHFPEKYITKIQKNTLQQVRENAERNAIVEALEHFEGNKKQAADKLNISLRLLYLKIDKYQI